MKLVLHLNKEEFATYNKIKEAAKKDLSLHLEDCNEIEKAHILILIDLGVVSSIKYEDHLTDEGKIITLVYLNSDCDYELCVKEE